MLQLIENLTRRVVRVTVDIATSIPVLVIAVVCVSVGDALAKPTYLAALSIQVAGSLQTQRRDGKIEEIVSSLIKPEDRLP